VPPNRLLVTASLLLDRDRPNAAGYGTHTHITFVQPFDFDFVWFILSPTSLNAGAFILYLLKGHILF
jgi:hypothetical protein